MKTMVFESMGSCLILKELPVPERGEGQVQIKIIAWGANEAIDRMRKGQIKGEAVLTIDESSD